MSFVLPLPKTIKNYTFCFFSKLFNHCLWIRLMVASAPPEQRTFFGQVSSGDKEQYSKMIGLQCWVTISSRIASVFYMKWLLDKILETGLGFLTG